MAAMGCRLKCLSKGYSMSVEDKRGGWAKPTLFFYFLLITEMPVTLSVGGDTNR
jgi:hypothetical protein